MSRTWCAPMRSAAIVGGAPGTALLEQQQAGPAHQNTAGSAFPAPPKSAASSPLAKQPDWMPRIWNGCDFFAWSRLLLRNRFAIHPSYWWIAVVVTVLCFTNTLLGLVESAIFNRAVRKTTIVEPPIFLLGHWRTGTTLLHELMACDERFGYPTTYQCLEPHHFLLTERLLARLL